MDSLEHSFQTVYIGGGTPTALGMEQLKKLFGSLSGHSKSSAEFTIEANPESLTSDKLSLFLNEGVNRLSIGVQSFCDNKLKALGRIHDAKQAEAAIESAVKAGFRNISIDLIFGAPKESKEGWRSDLKKALSLDVQHISCYGLTHDKDIMPPADDIMGEMFTDAIFGLEKAGFSQYEISNFSLSGRACLHNLNYWNNGSYIGLGPSAVSYIDGARSVNIPDVEEYVKRVGIGVSPVVSNEKLQPEESARETASVKIRTMEGIEFGWFKRKTGFDFMELEKDAVRKLFEDGLIESRDNGIKLTRRGILFCDVVSSGLL